MPPRRLLLDTASLYFRAYFGVPTLYAADGTTPVNAVRGLLDIIATFVRETHPDEVAACWDNDWRPSWRVALIEGYKSHRVAGGASGAPADPSLPIGAGGRGAASGVAEIAEAALSIQVPLIAAVLDAAGIATVGADGYEADDVSVLYVARGISKYETVDDGWLATRYGICGAQYVDYAVLRGDPSDGLPGVAGIGEKTAAKLLAEHCDLEGIAAATTLSPSIVATLAAAADYIGRARQVVAVRTDLLLPGDLSLPREVADPARFDRLCTELSLGSSATRFAEALRGR